MITGVWRNVVVHTFDPVQAATTSWIVHGVTITMNPRDMADIVRDVDPVKRRVDSRNCGQTKNGSMNYDVLLGECQLLLWDPSTMCLSFVGIFLARAFVINAIFQSHYKRSHIRFDVKTFHVQDSSNNPKSITVLLRLLGLGLMLAAGLLTLVLWLI